MCVDMSWHCWHHHASAGLGGLQARGSWENLGRAAGLYVPHVQMSYLANAFLNMALNMVMLFLSGGYNLVELFE